MRIGVRLPSAISHATPENVARVARWADVLGFHSVWVSDHIVLPERVCSRYGRHADRTWPHRADTPWFDPLLALAWAAAAAPHVALGTSILLLPLRHPVLLAKQLSTLDVVSGGRVLVAAGVGWMEEEFRLVGAPFGDRGARAVEMVRLMRALWTGRAVDFRGRFWSLSGCRMAPPPVQRPIPVLWGGHSRAALRRVAQVADGWHPSGLDPSEVAAGMTVLRKLCAERGRASSSLTIVPRLDRPLTTDLLHRYRDIGVDHLVIDPPLGRGDLDDCWDAMREAAAAGGLAPRADVGAERRSR